MAEDASFKNPELPEGEPIKGKTYRADGWVYHDIPWTTVEAWEQLIALVDDDNIVLLAASDRDGAIRGQVLISPDGMERIAGYNEVMKE